MSRSENFFALQIIRGGNKSYKIFTKGTSHIDDGTSKSRHTHAEKGCNTQEDERHSVPIFDIFDANLWVYFRKPQEGVSFFVHVKLTSPMAQNSLSLRNSLVPVHGRPAHDLINSTRKNVILRGTDDWLPYLLIIR
jgi:hypothetical protein